MQFEQPNLLFPGFQNFIQIVINIIFHQSLLCQSGSINVKAIVSWVVVQSVSTITEKTHIRLFCKQKQGSPDARLFRPEGQEPSFSKERLGRISGIRFTKMKCKCLYTTVKLVFCPGAVVKSVANRALRYARAIAAGEVHRRARGQIYRAPPAKTNSLFVNPYHHRLQLFSISLQGREKLEPRHSML